MSPGGLVSLCSAAKGTTVPSAGDREGNCAEHAPGRHFVTRIYSSKPIRKKGGKKRPRPATAQARWSLGRQPLLRRAGGVTRRMRLAVWKLVAGRSAPVSRMRTPAPAGEPAPAAGVYARWSRVGRRTRLRRWRAVAAAVQARLGFARLPRARGQSESVAEARGVPCGVQQGGDETGRGPGNVSETRMASRRTGGPATWPPATCPAAAWSGRPGTTEPGGWPRSRRRRNGRTRRTARVVFRGGGNAPRRAALGAGRSEGRRRACEPWS